ncbi:conserved Plasmodium protein, unknown function [Plasmodium knowlesi strain H]|uniref:Uncharacterized protein n=3 Tax=Plasmodium knowlesi TaxID=5850 RepID=A0A5K1U8N4_PLAKH|nr:conserved Plasmodium protein, unknown function [Plasmodium knowlesi strain H]OTN65187.1 Uncharacterized protein PKNOH_S120130400 [Plasmodium knowlesi]CAA9988167.1 conserved Plasmodium protein, unknown function [Plasmodium knowlesi strain H]SBO20074.1 conserved Plasmodium protein, unknown function [Plasmodium knowlesi strain H]SBO20737.1 conserved Plasmodium protein, unknown function [Plasmodium knowlesi strain H]VVS77641.1 conserved Plasmodium protein, unknown function [Plasmodium knowlesi |eukprot:XP_002259143.1 hypothetical protein, conserved in Plasmodium species [Plasmodium knowlesi strain H]
MDDCKDNESDPSIELQRNVHNALVVFGLIAEMILVDNHLLESVSINDIYKSVYSLLRGRYESILEVLPPCDERTVYITPVENSPEGKVRKSLLKEGKPLLETQEHKPNDTKDGETKATDESPPLAEQIKLKFSEIFLSPIKRKARFPYSDKLSNIKYAIAGCIYMHGKIWGKNVSLRNVLNAIDFNLFLLNNGFYTVKCGTSKKDAEQLSDTINQFEPTNKENIYYEKEQSLKMEKVCLRALSFNLTSSISKYALLYELMFITRSPYIVNKFLISVFNDVICIPDLESRFDDTTIIISCMLFVNHFLYHINRHDQLSSHHLGLIKKNYLSQVEKIVNIFLLLKRGNPNSGMKDVIFLTKEIVHLYSVTY